jgi:hypothetical protein
MAQLVKVESAGEFGLFEMGSNVFVRHLLMPSLQQIKLLFFAPCAPASRRSLLPWLVDTVLVAINDV